MSHLFAVGGFAAAIVGCVTGMVWTLLVNPGSRIEKLSWILGAVLNLPILYLAVRIMAGFELKSASDWEMGLLFAVLILGEGGFGIGWLAGLPFGWMIRALVRTEVARQA